MAQDILKSTTTFKLVFQLIASSDHITGLTGKSGSVTVSLSKNGAAGGTPSGAISEVDATNLPGVYSIAGNATDSGTAGPLWLYAKDSASDPYCALVANVIDPAVANYGTNLVNIAGSAVSTSSAQLGVNVVNFGTTAVTGRDIGANVLLSSGTGTGQLSLSSGAVLLQATQTGVTIPTVTTVTNQLTAGAIATGVWQDATAGDFTAATSIGKSIMNGVSLGTGLTVANLTNAPTAGDFTATMKTSIGTAVAASAVASVTAGVTVATNNDKTGYSIASGGIINGAHASAELNNIADAQLDRVMSTGVDSGGDNTTARTVRQALRVLRNKASIAAGTLTVNKEDDATASWTAAITTTAGNPISTVDPT